MLVNLSLDNLKHVDGGKIAEAIDLHLRRASIDCYDRPGDAKPRKVRLEIVIVPVLADDGSCVEVKAQMYADSAVPKHRTRVLSLGLRPNGTLLLNPDSPNDVNQGTLLNEEDDS